VASVDAANKNRCKCSSPMRLHISSFLARQLRFATCCSWSNCYDDVVAVMSTCQGNSWTQEHGRKIRVRAVADQCVPWGHLCASCLCSYGESKALNWSYIRFFFYLLTYHMVDVTWIGLLCKAT
jgi:hypothetical protein